MVETLDEYARLSDTQKCKVNKTQLKQIVDNQLTANQQVSSNGNTDNIRDVISEVVSAAVEKIIGIKIKEIVDEIKGILNVDREALNEEVTTLRGELNGITDEHKIMKKVMHEQQKCLESLKHEKIRNNAFISGIPNKTTIDGTETTDSNMIVKHILTFLLPTIVQEDYNVDKTFVPKEGFVRHSAIISFTSYEKKVELLGKCKDLKNRTEENDWRRRVFIRSEQTPLTNRENSRLYGEYKKRRDEHSEDRDTVIKLEKGKLYLNGVVVDEFNLINQIF